MSSLSNVSLPKPKDWQDFERKTRVLFASVLADPNTQMHGRSGQNQHGVDVWGYRNGDRAKLVGIQCEKSDNAITEVELQAELEKARDFKPAITEFILVTTAQRDAKIQRSARELTGALALSTCQIFVAVWGWEDVEEHAAQYAEVWRAFDPTYNPYAALALQETPATVEPEPDVDARVAFFDILENSEWRLRQQQNPPDPITSRRDWPKIRLSTEIHNALGQGKLTAWGELNLARGTGPLGPISADKWDDVEIDFDTQHHIPRTMARSRNDPARVVYHGVMFSAAEIYRRFPLAKT
jgi:hypothetical protein